MVDGVSNREMEALNKEAWNCSLNYRQECVKAQLARYTADGFALTPKGWLLSDKIFSELFY